MTDTMLQIAVDVGNTEIAIGLVRGGVAGMEVLAHWRMSTPVARTSDEFEQVLASFLQKEGVDPTATDGSVMGSVVPAITPDLGDALERLCRKPTRIVRDATALGIHLDVEEPRTVGADRIVNTLAAKVLYGRDTVVVDLGTATTFDCISEDGVFIGGVIAPGVLSGLRWLGEGTAKLPSVEFRPPDHVIGRRTEACMESGVFYSAVDSIDGIVERIRAEWDRPDALVVATGGFAERVAPHCTTVDRQEPFLTLFGLALAGAALG